MPSPFDASSQDAFDKMMEAMERNRESMRKEEAYWAKKEQDRIEKLFKKKKKIERAAAKNKEKLEVEAGKNADKKLTRSRWISIRRLLGRQAKLKEKYAKKAQKADEAHERLMARKYKKTGIFKAPQREWKELLPGKVTRPKDLAIGAIAGTLSKFGKLLKSIVNNPLAKFFTMLTDYNAVFEFNRAVNTAAGGLDMMHGSLGDASANLGMLDNRLSDLASGFESMGTNLTYMLTATERAEIFGQLETFGGKTADLVDSVVEGFGDITTAASAMGRVTGRAATEIANRMGEISFQTGIVMDDMAKVFAGFIKDASDANLSQRRFMDAMVSASQAVGLYQQNLFAAQKVLRKMTEDTVTPFAVALQNFEGVLRSFQGMSEAQIVATINFSALDAQFQEGLALEQEILRNEFNKAIEGLSESALGDLDFETLLTASRGEANRLVRELGDMTDEQRDAITRVSLNIQEMGAVLTKEGREQALGVADAVTRNAMDPNLLMLALNSLTKQLTGVESFADAEREQLRMIAGVLGKPLQELMRMQRDIYSSDETLALMEEQLNQDEFMSEALREANATSLRLQSLLESPDKSFEAIMTDLVRTIQRAVLDLVRKYMPYVVDLALKIVDGVGWLIEGIGKLIRINPLGGREMSASILKVGEEIRRSALVAERGLRVSYMEQIGAMRSPLEEQKKSLEEGLFGPMGDLGQGSYVLRAQEEALAGFREALDLASAEDRPRLEALIQETEQQIETTEGLLNQYRSLEDQLDNFDSQVAGVGDGIGALGSVVNDLASSMSNLEDDISNLWMQKSLESAAQSGLSLSQAVRRSSRGSDSADQLFRIFSSEEQSHGFLKKVGQDWQELLRVPGFSEWIQSLVEDAEGPGNFIEQGEDQIRDTLRAFNRRREAMITPPLPGRALGGIDYSRRLVQVGDAGPEATLPLSRVPDVFARTLDKVGGGTSSAKTINIEHMEFMLPETAKDNEGSWASAVRRVIATEFAGMLREDRLV